MKLKHWIGNVSCWKIRTKERDKGKIKMKERDGKDEKGGRLKGKKEKER